MTLVVAVLAAGVAVTLSRLGAHRTTAAVGRSPAGSPPAGTHPRTHHGAAALPATPARPPVPVLHWTACGGGAQCSTLVVPLSWSGRDPAARGHTLPLALIRFPATGPGTRIGSLVVNPGGPGGSGVTFLRQAIGEIPAVIRARFDVVSFDPRGVGASAPVECLSGPQLDALVHLPPVPQNPTQLAAVVAGARLEDSACARRMGDELRHVSTVDVARDLDFLRAALGDAKLTYLGYSYGTAIGATYARLFPTHIRAMVLDGALNPAISAVGLLRSQAGGFELEFDSFLSWCAGPGRAQCPFAGYATAPGPAGVGAAFQALRQRISAHPLPVGNRSVGAGEFFNGVTAPLYSPATGWPALGVALADAEAGNGALLLSFNDSYVERSPSGQYSNLEEANLAVNCVDRPWPRHVSTYADLAAQLGRQYPYFGAAIGWSGLGCAFWPAPPTGHPAPVHAPGAPPILVIATTGDPATPYAQGVALAHQLDSGVLLTHIGNGHTVYRVPGDMCVVNLVDVYLLTLHAPPRATGATCH